MMCLQRCVLPKHEVGNYLISNDGVQFIYALTDEQ